MGKRGPAPGRPELPLRTDPERQRKFLTVLEQTGSLIEAARQASPHSEKGAMSSFKSYMRDDPAFAARVGEALDRFRDSLVREAVRRGRDGVQGRPIHYKGEIIAYERVYSDNLLLAELRRHFPQHYSEKHQHEHRHAIVPAGAWVISSEDLSYLDGSDRRTLAALMDKVRAGRGERQAIEHHQTIDAKFTEVDDTPEVWELAYEETADD